ncbi:MAG TPA: hypothetical protein PJ984_02225 [Candidatus Saccharibacteria bacterium]|nr:hypothetical protein [Candidatus Saccharibacteria bacterium]
MSFITKGKGSGEISISLKRLNVPKENWPDIVRQASRKRQVRRVKLDEQNGWLVFEIEVGHLNPQKRSDVAAKIELEIVTFAKNFTAVEADATS